MKQSDKATGYILVKAGTNSEWDNCRFAIISLSEQWKKEQAQRLELLRPFADDYNFRSLNYYDAAVEFYGSGGNNQQVIDELLKGREWVFVEFEGGEQEEFILPENRIDCYRLVLSANGTGYYSAYGKHTGEEFWAEVFSIAEIVKKLSAREVTGNL